MVYNSLTDVPHNLREGIDWLIALKGTDGEKNLAAMGSALYDLLADKPVGKKVLPALEQIKPITKQFLEKPGLKGHWSVKRLLGRFSEPMNKTIFMWFKHQWGYYASDYENIIQTEGVKLKDMVENLGKVVHGTEKFLDDIKNPDEYKSAYSSEATWDASCAKNPEACAMVLVGIAPMLYAGLLCLWNASDDAAEKWLVINANERFEKLLKALDYKEPDCKDNLSAAAVRKALCSLDNSVDILYDLAGFWAFY
ncbi:hypothetical protein BBBOND_0109880 [Babesia bigemina]|uniref:Uncharacterized protein n=1 Tax=Babesia bigemina TaxID=5866 RepID=A0A061DAD1_BABBI|nr:hypothetical protein BBBOND_0109880 [Babesia bigemina]CDR94690.1 hypothetical protein BBBOND_0109880 [Babesia bigemina]|eukprot:XP_012766876.1 hypothetical protein BBBOND_0109880 [Babesia bigemina]